MLKKARILPLMKLPIHEKPYELASGIPAKATNENASSRIETSLLLYLRKSRASIRIRIPSIKADHERKKPASI